MTTLGELAVFELKGDEKFEKLKLSYVWTVSGGAIYTGQGTKTLVVSSKDLNDTTIKATVTIEGLPADCEKTSSEITGIAAEPKPEQIDEYGINTVSVKAQIDNFFVRLQNDPNASEIIVLRSKTKETLIKQIQTHSRAMFFRKYDLARIGFRIIFDNNAETVEY